MMDASLPGGTSREKKDDKISLLKTVYKPYGQREDEKQHGRRDSTFHSVKTTLCQSKKYVTAMLAAVATVLLMVVLSLIAILGGDPSLRTDLVEPSNEREEKVLVSTSCGQFIGTEEDGAFAFKGVPYAKPPLGVLRWRKPIPLWTDQAWCRKHRRQNAVMFSSACFQLNPYSKQYLGQEDCLYLNVWTPTLNGTAGLEVMVLIHGGFLQFGSGNQMGLSPHGKLAKNLNIIFVSFNYRLHALGFLALDMLVDNPLTDSAGNYGLWDQMVALQWVRDNVRQFGGDPRKVTVFGADAGGGSILALMTSPVTSRLFRSAWIIGPTMIFNKTFTEASRHQRAHFLEKSGCSDEECLRKMTPKEVTATFLGKDDPSFRIRDQNDLPIQGIFPEQLVVIDGQLLATSPIEALQRGQESDVPVLLGTAAQAVDFWPGPDDLRYWRWNQYKKYVTTSLDSYDPKISERALRLYSPSDAGVAETPEYLYTTMVTDVRQTCPMNDLAELMSQSMTSPVYRYILTSFPSSNVRIYDYNASYSFHSWEMVAFLDNLRVYLEKPTESDVSLQETIQDIVTSFVKKSSLEAENLKWLKYPKSIINLTSTASPMESYHKKLCKFWASNGLNDYAWVS